MGTVPEVVLSATAGKSDPSLSAVSWHDKRNMRFINCAVWFAVIEKIVPVRAVQVELIVRQLLKRGG